VGKHWRPIATADDEFRHAIGFLLEAIAWLIHRQLRLQAFFPACGAFATRNNRSAARAFSLKHSARRASE
jgi:hypothetical protein